MWTAHTVACLTAGTGVCWGVKTPWHWRGSVEQRLLARLAGSTPVTPCGVTGLAGGGRTAVWVPLGRGGPHVSTLGRPPIGTGSTQPGASPEAVDEGMRCVGTAACPGALLPSTNGGLLRGPWSTTTTAGCMGAGPRTRGARTVVMLRRPRGRTGASPRTLTSARGSGMPPAMMAAPRRPRAARWPRPMTIGRRSARRIGEARPATGTDDCSAATTPGSPTLLRTCAACFLWREFRNTWLPCGHQPTDPYPVCCDVCRFYVPRGPG